ncbi:MAG: hypothetical protein ABSF53_11260 [Terracidiphilus sp.]
MNRSIQIIFCLTAAFGAGSAIAQTYHDETPSSDAPVAYVYVSRPTHLDGFAASSSGVLTPVPGSPLAGTSVAGLATNGKYLFGDADKGGSIDAFTIASNGALELAASTAIATDGCTYSSPLILDHTGETLYVELSNCDNSYYESYKVGSTGELELLGSTSQIFLLNAPLTFSSNNKYAYGSQCIDYRGAYLDTFAGYDRNSSGLLRSSGITEATPRAKSGDFYCRSVAAADPDGHVAVALQPLNSESEYIDGPPQIASFTVGSTGNLSTNNNYSAMPTATGGANVLTMSPSGKLLAVGGQGLEIFHFNGSSPITGFSSLLQSGIVFEQLAWDGDNHLYALGSGKLFVYTVTPTSIKEAPGSPYSIPEAAGLAVVTPK